MKFAFFCINFHENEKEDVKKKTENARKNENVKNRRRKKNETHNFKNEDAKKKTNENEDVNSWRTM